VDQLERLFTAATALLVEGPGRSAFRSGSSQVNAALAEAVMVGLLRRLETDDTLTPEAATEAVTSLMQQESLSMAISRATADEEAVRTRLGLSTRVFAGA